MSFLVRAAPASRIRTLHARVCDAFGYPYEKPHLVSCDAVGMCKSVSDQLRPMNVPFLADHSVAVACSLRNVTVVSLSGALSSRTHEVAEYTARMCALWGYCRKVTVVLAVAPQNKHISFDRALTMRDINSGVTFPAQNQIIMFRYDSDFWKVLCHELIHLCCGEQNEAITECKALLVHTMAVSRDWDDFQMRFGRQISLSRQNASILGDVDPGATNAALYWQIGEDMLEHAEEVLAGSYIKHSAQQKQHKHQHACTGEMDWIVSAYGHESGLG